MKYVCSFENHFAHIISIEKIIFPDPCWYAADARSIGRRKYLDIIILLKIEEDHCFVKLSSNYHFLAGISFQLESIERISI